MLCMTAASSVPPAAAQGQAGGVPTETQEREKSGGDGNILWNIIGLARAARPSAACAASSDNDGYTRRSV